MYIVTNPAWPGHVKVGITTDYKKRLRQYQTGCPNRAYRLDALVFFPDHTIGVERSIHLRLRRHAVNGEWFHCSVSEALDAILMERIAHE